jgi:hypothetical protein
MPLALLYSISSTKSVKYAAPSEADRVYAEALRAVVPWSTVEAKIEETMK